MTKRFQETRKILAMAVLGAAALLSLSVGAAHAEDNSVRPVLMVVADQQDFYYQEYGGTQASVDEVMGALPHGPVEPPRGLPNLTGQVGKQAISMLLPAVQAARESARRNRSPAQDGLAKKTGAASLQRKHLATISHQAISAAD